jgi:glycosyltransferase involved in cell wall biosynthesis
VVVPTYNRVDFVVDAVTSLLTQGVLVPEVIVVDDGSTDDTARALAGFGDSIVYVRQDNAGPSAARNTGVRRAGGELVAFLDSDNLCGPQSLDRRAARLAADPDIDLVLGRTQVVELCDGVGGAPDYEPRARRCRFARSTRPWCGARRSTGSARSTSGCGSARTTTGSCGPTSSACASRSIPR